MQALAKRLSLSDRGLAKICAAANIPVPTRGYWAKQQAGKSVTPLPLPPRALGQSDVVHIGRDRYGHASDDAETLTSPIPPPPVFEPDMAVVHAQATALVAKAPLPLRDTHGWHSQLQKLLDADELRAQKQRASPYPSSWDAPIFGTRFEKRRLGLLNALFTCLTRCGMKPRVSGKEGRDVSVTVGDTHVPLLLDAAGGAKQLERERHGYAFVPRGDKDRMRLSVSAWWSAETDRPSWEDQPGSPVERHLREIAAAIIVFAEQSVRDSASYAHARRIERKAELEEAERARRAEEERRRQERLAQLEKARVDLLLAQADALSHAQQIRAYVDAVRTLNPQAPDPMPADELESWTRWALSQADRIDPVISGAYKHRPTEGGE